MGNNNSWLQIGDEIEDILRSVKESQDFKKLNETIARTADEALGNVERTVQKAMDKAHEKVRQAAESGEKWEDPRQMSGSEQNRTAGADSRRYGSGSYKQREDRGTYGNYERNSTIRETRFRPGYEKARDSHNTQLSLYRERYRSTTALSSTGIVLTACGYSFLGILLIVWFIILGLTISGNGHVAAVTTGIMAPFIVGSSFMAYKGTSLLGRKRRFRRYVETLREREFCQIRELADTLGKSEAFVKKDLNKMIQKRLFLHGHLDKQETCLMVTDKAYEQYRAAQQQLEERREEEKRKEAESRDLGKRKDLPKEAREIIETGKQYLEEIKKSNDRIPGEEVSEKISRLELVVSKIFNRVEQHPELIEDLGRFMDYYLPTTVKLLKAYEELDAQPVQGANIKASKKEIEDTLDTIAKAFEKLLDSFFEQAAWDISSDISVLHNMFAQEGLTESEFEKIHLKS